MHTAIVQHVPAPALALAMLLGLVGCGKPPANGPAAADPGAAAPAAASTAPKADDVKIAKENWPNGKLKYFYELRRSPDGKWARNGVGRAYYDHGVLEREGTYKNNVRVGEWKYYDQDGKLLRTEDRGAGQPEAG